MNKKYQIIYADPPYAYNDKRVHSGKHNPTGAGGAAKHYKSMGLEQICSLPIQDISDTNCHLFLWATCPLLPEAIKVMSSWGFKYIGVCYVWIKMKNDMSEFRKDGIGNYTLNNAELVLLGRTGKYRRESRKEKQIVLHPKMKHSQKPNCIRGSIVRLIGDLPRIELFARKPDNVLFEDESWKDWDVWGNEVESDIEL